MAEFKKILTLQTESGQSVSIDLRNALILAAAPTTSTAARAGMQAYVVSGGTITAEYVCTAVSGSTYTWVEREVSGGGSGLTGVMTPDDFDGTDAEKLQACFDALSGVGGIITINRALSINKNIEIENNSDYNHQIVVVGSGESATINMGGFCFCGRGTNPGLVSFDNLQFSGTNKLVEAENLIRLRFDGCLFSGFQHVINSENYIQSVNIVNSYVRGVTGYIYHAVNEPAEGAWNSGDLLDCRFAYNVVEQGNGVAAFVSAWGCQFTGNCIEGNTGTDDLFTFGNHMNGVEISNNYFELNGGHLVDFTNSIGNWSQLCVTICNNHFMETDAGKTMIVMPDAFDTVNSNIIIYGNDMPTSGSSVLLSTGATDRIKRTIIYANRGNISDPNGVLTPMDADEMATMYRYTKTMLPIAESKFFQFTGFAVPVTASYAYMVVNTPYDMTSCGVESLALFGLNDVVGADVAYSVSAIKTGSFLVECVAANAFDLSKQYFVEGQCYIKFN